MTNACNPQLTFTDEELATCRRLVAQKHTDFQIARQLARTPAWVRSCRIAAGVTEYVVPRTPRLFNEIVNGVVVGPHPITYEDLRRLPPCPINANYIQRRQANAAFLISLKRALHEYGAGEWKGDSA